MPPSGIVSEELKPAILEHGTPTTVTAETNDTELVGAVAVNLEDVPADPPEKFVTELKWYVWNVTWQAANSTYAGTSEGAIHDEKLRMAGEDQLRVEKHFNRLIEFEVLSAATLQRLQQHVAAVGSAVAATAAEGQAPSEPSLSAAASAFEASLAASPWRCAARAARLAALAVANMLLNDHFKSRDSSFADPSYHMAGVNHLKEFEELWDQLRQKPPDAAAEPPEPAPPPAPTLASVLDGVEEGETEEAEEGEEAKLLPEALGLELKWLVWNATWRAANAAYAAAAESVREAKQKKAVEDLQRLEGHYQTALSKGPLRACALQRLGRQASAGGRMAAATALEGRPLAEGGVKELAAPGQLRRLWPRATEAASLAAEAVAEMLLDEWQEPGAVEAGKTTHYAKGVVLQKEFEHAWHQLYDRPPALPSPAVPPPRPLTVEWLAAKARFSEGRPLIAREEELPQELDEGMASSCSFLRLRLAGGAGEEWYVVKRAVSEHTHVGLLTNEHNFYKEVAPSDRLSAIAKFLYVPRPLVTCSPSGPEGASASNFLLVLERLQPPAWTRVDPVIGCSAKQAVDAAHALGQFHAAFSMSAAADWAPLGPLVGPEPLDPCFGGCFPRCIPRLVKLLPPPAFAVCSRLAKGGLSMLVQRLRNGPVTLLHGDYRTENLRFNAGGSTAPVAAFDWGLISRGLGTWDFAHFLALSLTPERRRGHEQEIVRKYLQQFPGNRTTEHELNKFKDEVRAGFLCLIAKLLFVYTDFKGKESTSEMLERSIRWVASAAEEWQATSVLERGWF